MRKNEFIPYMRILLIKKDIPVIIKDRIIRIFEKLLFCIFLEKEIENRSDNYHRNRENLPHSESEYEVSESNVGSTNKFDTEAKYAIPYQKTCCNLPREYIFLSQGKKNHKKYDSF